MRYIRNLIWSLCRTACRSSFPETTTQSMYWKKIPVLFLCHRVLFSEFSLAIVYTNMPITESVWIMVKQRDGTKLCYQICIISCKTTIHSLKLKIILENSDLCQRWFLTKNFARALSPCFFVFNFHLMIYSRNNMYLYNTWSIFKNLLYLGV